jgi:hypothetical protein
LGVIQYVSSLFQNIQPLLLRTLPRWRGLQVESAPKRDPKLPGKYHGTKFTVIFYGSTICLSRSTTWRGAMWTASTIR